MRSSYKSFKRRIVWLSVVITIAGIGLTTWFTHYAKATSAYIPQDHALRRPDVYLFHAQGSSHAFIWLYGNDVAFWRAHQELATLLASRGYDVVGFDARHFFDATSATGSARDSLVARTISTLVAHARHEFHDDTLPVIVAGHSLGADLAAWTAAHVTIPRLVGVVMLNPTRRSHLYATMRDRAFLGEPIELGSYAAADVVRRIPPNVRVVVARGDHDSHNAGDTALVTAVVTSGHASDRTTAYRRIPFAGHSLRSLFVAGPVITHIMDDLVTSAHRTL